MKRTCYSILAVALVNLLAWGTGNVLAATPLTSVRIASGLARPVLATAPPGDTNRLFILEQYTGNA